MNSLTTSNEIQPTINVPLSALMQIISWGYNLVVSFAQIDDFESVLSRNKEFCVVLSVAPNVFRAAVRRGIFVMSIDFGHNVVLGALKLHRERCVLRLDSGALHISRSTRKKYKRFEFSVNRAFRQVAAACAEQHGRTNWLIEPLVSTLLHFHRCESPSDIQTHSIEVWQDGKLVAGEIGYSLGAIYTSMTGFHTVSSSGSVQLARLGELLLQRKFKIWDFGMAMKYKLQFGASKVPRAEWLQMVAENDVATLLALDDFGGGASAVDAVQPEQ